MIKMKGSRGMKPLKKEGWNISEKECMETSKKGGWNNSEKECMETKRDD